MFPHSSRLAVEGTAILDVMSNRYCKSRSKVKGDFILNGAYLNPSKLSELVAYVNQETEVRNVKMRFETRIALYLRRASHLLTSCLIWLANSSVPR